MVVTLLLAWVCAQATPKLEATLREVPAAEGRPPRFAVAGTLDVPNGHTVLLYLYFQAVDPGSHIIGERVAVKDRAFSHEFTLFKEKTLRGTWVLRAIYDPNLQPAGGDVPSLLQGDAVLRHGTEAEAAEDRKAASERLAGEFRAVAALGQELRAKLAAQPKPDAAAWKAFHQDLKKKSLAIQARALPQRNPEYRIYDLSSTADSVLESLCHILNASVDCAVRGQELDAAEGLTRLARMAETQIGELAAPRLTTPAQVAALIAKIRDELKQGSDLPARRRFLERVQLLSKSCPEDRADLVLAISGRGAAYFNAAADGKPEAAQLLKETDQALDALDRTLPR
jgi:hypothetical protein